MPELPEVESIAREMRSADLVGKAICSAVVYWPKTVSTHAPKIFSSRVSDQAIVSIERRGKHLVLRLSRDTLLIHLRMTGRLLVRSHGNIETGYERLALQLNDGRWLVYEDPRKFGRWQLTDRPDDVLREIGPEPLDPVFTSETLLQVLKGRRTKIKALLLNQALIAGLGNIYADEALWEARLHPERSSSTLTMAEVVRLHGGIQNALSQGLAAGGTSLGKGKGNYRGLAGGIGGNQQQLQVYRRTGQPCRRCGTPITKVTVTQRSSHFCPQCQKR